MNDDIAARLHDLASAAPTSGRIPSKVLRRSRVGKIRTTGLAALAVTALVFAIPAMPSVIDRASDLASKGPRPEYYDGHLIDWGTFESRDDSEQWHYSVYFAQGQLCTFFEAGSVGYGANCNPFEPGHYVYRWNGQRELEIPPAVFGWVPNEVEQARVRFRDGSSSPVTLLDSPHEIDAKFFVLFDPPGRAIEFVMMDAQGAEIKTQALPMRLPPTWTDGVVIDRRKALGETWTIEVMERVEAGERNLCYSITNSRGGGGSCWDPKLPFNYVAEMSRGRVWVGGTISKDVVDVVVKGGRILMEPVIVESSFEPDFFLAAVDGGDLFRGQISILQRDGSVTTDRICTSPMENGMLCGGPNPDDF